jgi:hypothetical protein
VVATTTGRYRLGDPRRLPGWAWSSLRAPVAPLQQKLRLVAWVLGLEARSRTGRTAGSDVAIGSTLGRLGLEGAVADSVLRPFLSGVLGEAVRETSTSYVEQVLLAFLRGTPAVPADGMQQLPRRLAAALPPGSVRTSTPVDAVRRDGVETAGGQISARAVVVATDAAAAHRLCPGVPEVPVRALTTLYHLAGRPPTDVAALHIDGSSRGPVVNTSLLSAVAPGYADAPLISSTVLGAHDDAATESAVRTHLAAIYGVDTRGWTHLRTYALPAALPAVPAPLAPPREPRLSDGVYVAGDWCTTPSQQGALSSGRRAAEAVLADLAERP